MELSFTGTFLSLSTSYTFANRNDQPLACVQCFFSPHPPPLLHPLQVLVLGKLWWTWLTGEKM